MQKYTKTIDYAKFLGKILLVRKTNGREFVSMLAKIEDNGATLVFRTRKGTLVTNNAADCIYAVEV